MKPPSRGRVVHCDWYARDATDASGPAWATGTGELPVGRNTPLAADRYRALSLGERRQRVLAGAARKVGPRQALFYG
jgi:hypothetical protein